MNEREFERTARAWLDDGPTRMSDRAVLSALEEIHTTRQRRSWWPARRATPVNIFVRAAIAAVLVVGVGIVAINVLPRGSDGSGVGGGPTASLSASPPQSASPPSPPPSQAPAVDIPELTQTFVSSFNGFSIGYPDDATIVPAKVAAIPGVEQDNNEFDYVETDTYTVRGASHELPNGYSIDEWVDRKVQGVDCGVPRNEQPEIVIDGQPGRVWEGCPGEIEATVEAGGRVYVFSLFGEGTSRPVFDAYASTIDLLPEDAAVPSASPSP